jgi:gentisate 1,2-dioxygenase
MSAEAAQALAGFSTRISGLSLSPLWERKARLVPGSDCVPAIWRYAEMRPLLAEAAELITKKQAERRVLVMENPALRGSSFITNALYAGLQIIKPGEVAPSHRHTPSALRFVVEGEGAYTAVSGERLPMRPGDFVVTPPWAWHDHGNEGDGPVVWLDGLDTPFAQLFGAHFRENWPDERYPLNSALNDGKATPPLHYAYTDTRDTLRAMALDTAPHAAHGHRLRYGGDANTGHPFRTMAAFMQRLPEGFRGRPQRSTEGAVFNVAQGECRVELAGVMHTVLPHDSFVVPPWEPFRFEADGEALLFSFSDRAAQEVLGYWREETL